jgi:very-short-patch-repair endonuclease
VEPISGVILHRSTRAEQARHPSLLPPRTRIEETVLDLVQQAADFDAAFDWACRACQRRLTKADLLASAMTRRTRLRWRAELAGALADIGEGVHSLLEYRYVRDVERRHGLPAAHRQARARRGYLDNLYEEYQVCVELDGRAAHPDDRRWQDVHRDNAAASEGQATLRYHWADITQRPCSTAWQVGATLLQRGWPGPLRPCPRCTPRP